MKAIIEFFRRLFFMREQKTENREQVVNLPPTVSKTETVADTPIIPNEGEELFDGVSDDIITNHADKTLEKEFQGAPAGDERISANFTMREFGASATAKREGIDNTIPGHVKPAIRALVHNILQPLRTATGWAMTVTSGYRSEALNRAVGGAASSQHRTGEAADIVFTSNGGRVAIIDAARRVKSLGLPFDQMKLYNTFLHLSFTEKRANRGQVLYSRDYMGARL
jgi:hypothetical protein